VNNFFDQFDEVEVPTTLPKPPAPVDNEQKEVPVQPASNFFDQFDEVETEVKVPVEEKKVSPTEQSVIDKAVARVTDIYNSIFKPEDSKEAAVEQKDIGPQSSVEHMARALGIDTDLGDYVGFDPSGMSFLEHTLGKPLWQIKSRKAKPSPYKRTMDELAVDSEWNKAAKLIYDYEQKNKGSFAVLELPANWGKTDLVKEGEMSHGEWLQERFSKGFQDFASLGITLSKAHKFPDKLKKAWIKAIKMEMETEGDLASFGRAVYYGVSDPTLLATLGTGAVLRGLAKVVGGKAATQATKSLFIKSLEQLLKPVSKYSPVISVSNELMSRGIEKKLATKLAKGKKATTKENLKLKERGLDQVKVNNLIRVARKEATVYRVAAAPIAGMGWAALGDLLVQSLGMEIGMPSPEASAELAQRLSLDMPVPPDRRKKYWMYVDPERKMINKDLIGDIVSYMKKDNSTVAKEVKEEAKILAKEFASKEGRSPTEKDLDAGFTSAVMDRYMRAAFQEAEKAGHLNLQSPDSISKWFKQINWDRFGQALEGGLLFGTALGLGGYMFGKAFRKFAGSEKKMEDREKEFNLSLRGANIDNIIDDLKADPDAKPIVTRVVGEITEEGPRYSDEWKPLPLRPITDKLIISGYIPKGSNKEYIFNEAVQINNSLTVGEKGKGGILNLEVEEGTTKRQIQEIKNKFKLANIELQQTGKTSFEGRKIEDVQLSSTGRPVSEKDSLQIETTEVDVTSTSEKVVTKGVTPTGGKFKTEVEISPEGGVMEGPLPKFLTEEMGPPSKEPPLPPPKEPLPPPEEPLPPPEEPPPPVGGELLIPRRHVVKEWLGKANTLGARMLTTEGSLPIDLAEAGKTRTRDIRGTRLKVRKALRDIKRIKKLTQTSDEDFAFAINEGVMEVKDLEGNVLRRIHPELQEGLNKLYKIIQDNEDTINNLLGLKGEQRIGLGISKGDVYFTKNYEAAYDPKYLEKIRKALETTPKIKNKDIIAAKKADMPIQEYMKQKYTNEFTEKVNDARDYFINKVKVKKRKGETEQDYYNRIDGVIESLVTNLTREEKGWFTKIFEGEDVTQGLGGYASQILRHRKVMDDAILNLLGEIKNPYTKIVNTLTNQNMLISEIEWLRSIEEFANKNSDKVINLGGLIPKLHTKRTAISSKGPRAGEVTKGLEDLVKETIGKFGRRPVTRKVTAKDRAAAKKENIPINEYMDREYGESSILPNMFTTQHMADIISKGTDLWAGTSGSYLMRMMGKLAAFGQAGQTILDLPAYALNFSGAVQAMAMNGYLLRPSTLKGNTIKHAFGGVRLLIQQARAGNIAAINELIKLKKQGIIETDVAAELIESNLDIPGLSPGTGKKGSIENSYDSAMKLFGTTYGIPDSWSKIAAHRIERDQLKWMFPNWDEDKIFSEASKRVRAVMPSYGDAFPVAKALSRLPIGTYALFPSEIVRTHKNIFMLGAKDIWNGAFKNKNIKQVASGLTRWAAMATTMGGIAALVSTNNETNNITDYNERFINTVSPAWGKASSRFHLQPFQLEDVSIEAQLIRKGVDPKLAKRVQEKGLYKLSNKDFYKLRDQGIDAEKYKQLKEISKGKPRILSRFISSTSFDAYDFNKAPVRELMGKLLAGNKKLTQFEIDEAFNGMKESIMGPYTNKKFLWEAIMNIAANKKSESGRPLWEDIPGEDWEKRWDIIKAAGAEIAEAIQPGTSDWWNKYSDSVSSEDKRGIALGRTASGFPANSNDIILWGVTGMRPQTIDIEKAMGYNLSKDIRVINNIPKVFNRFVSELDDIEYTPEVGEKIVNKYLELQDRKLFGVNNLSDKIRIFSNVSYYDLNNKEVFFDQTGVLAAATDNFWYDHDEMIVTSNFHKDMKKGIVVADRVDRNKRLRKIIIDKYGEKNLNKVLVRLVKAFEGIAIRPIKEKEEE